MKIVAIVGSFRKDSLNKQLAEHAKRLCESFCEPSGEVSGESPDKLSRKFSVDFEILDFSDVPFMNQDVEFPAPEAVARVRERIMAADGVWFFTPEYNHFFPGLLKNLIDWLSRPVSLPDGKQGPQVLNGKPAAISGISMGMSGTGLAQDHLVTLLSFLNMRIMNSPRLVIPNGLQQVKEGRLTLESSKSYLEKQGHAFISFIKEK